MSGEPPGELACGVWVALLVADGLDEADALVGELVGDDVLFAGVAEVVAPAGCVDAGLVQLWLELGLGLGSVRFWPAPAELELLLALGEAGAVVVGVPSGLGLGLMVALGLVLALGEVLVLAEAVVLGLAVLLLLWLALDDVAGAVGLLGGLLLVCVADG